MIERVTDPDYLRYQYGDAEKLRARQEVHARYSENRQDFFSWVISHLAARPGLSVLDVGCGPGTYHPTLGRLDVRIIGVDASAGMVREARRQAADLGLPVAVVQAGAESLPLPDGACDRAMANHVLFHVPDRLRALRELRRVLKPGGRVVLTTNAADHMARLHALHERAARELGYTPTPRAGARFSLDDLPLVRSVFPGAERQIMPNAFLFPTPEPALRHYASGPVDAIRELPPDGSHRPKLLALVEAGIEAIIRKEGVFRVPKDVGCFVAGV